MIGPVEPGSVFTPEQLSDEHRAIRDAVAAFVEKEVGPRRDAVEGRDHATHRALLRATGARRLSRYRRAGGVRRRGPRPYQQPRRQRGDRRCRHPSPSPTPRTPASARCPSSSSAPMRRSAATCPASPTGTRVGAYCLTEPAAGSDAMGIRTRATRAAGRPMAARRHEAVHHQRRLRRPLHRLRQDRRRGLLRLFGRARHAGPDDRRRGGEDGHARRSTCPVTLDGVDRRRRTRCSARRARAIGSPSTSSTSGRFKLGAACMGGMRPALGIATRYASDRTAFGRRLATSRSSAPSWRPSPRGRTRSSRACIASAACSRRSLGGGGGRHQSGGDPRRARGVRGRVLDRQGPRQRGARLRRRRAGADPRWLRLHRGVPRRRASTATLASTASGRAPTRSTGCSCPARC